MKPEINNENKAKFFALYWGQCMYSKTGANWVSKFHDLSEIDEEDYLLLKPLSQISDEDAKDCNYEDARQFNFYLGKRIGCPELHDILRSKGYAVEWMGLSIEEMVEAGWIKLID